MPSSHRRYPLLLPITLMALILTARVQAQPKTDGEAPAVSAPGTNAAEETMSFHRVYVPADQIDAWPRGAVRYVPMDRDAFERVTAEIAAEAISPTNREAHIERAEYAGRLTEDGSLRGRAELVVAHHAKRSVLLALGDCDLAISNAAWTTEPTQAVLGVAADQKLKLVVARSGTLRFDFVLPRNGQNRRNRLVAAIPAGTTTRLLLDTPAELTPVGENAIIDSINAESATADNEIDAKMTDTAMADAMNSGGRRQWQIELGSRGRLDLSMIAPRASRDRVVLSRQTTDYKVASSGVAINSTIMLDVYQEPLDRIVLRLDAGVTLIATRVAGQIAKVVESRRAADGAQWMVVEPSEPLLGTDQAVVIEAAASANIGRRWRLPSISAQDGQWQQSTARITAEAPLRIEQLFPTNSVFATAVSPREATLRHSTVDGAIEIIVNWADRDIRAATLTQLEIGSEARGQAILNAIFSDSTTATVTGTVDEGWFVESIAATPAEALRDWRVVANERDKEKIVVECRPGSSRQVKLSATVRWRDSPERRPLTAGDLRVINWRESCHVTRSLVSLAPAQSYQLTPQRSHRLALVDSGDDAISSLLAGQPGTLQFELESATAAFTVGAHRAATPFRAELNTELLVVDKHRLRETFHARCTPQGEGLARVVVRLSPPSPDPVAWTLSGESGEALSAHRLSDDELRAFLIEPGSEAWLIALPQPRAAAFEIVGERTRPLASSAPIVLAAVQEAESQTGQITVRAGPSTRIAIDNRRLTALPLDDGPATTVSDVQAIYRYAPARDVLSTEVAATISRPDATASANAIAYACRVDVRVHPSGQVEHRARYSIENFGRDVATVTLPGDTARYAIVVDGKTVARGISDAQSVRAPLPSSRRFVTLVVDYISDGAPSAWFARTEHVAPQIDMPVLHREWSLWVPEQYQLLGDAATHVRSASWTERWFGPLSRAVEEPPFDPDSWQDWLGQGHRQRQHTEARATVASFIERLGNARSSLVDRNKPTWGDLISAVADEQLFVDAEALDRIGIAPWKTLPVTTRGSKAAVAAQLLFDSGIGVLTDGTRMLLTSSKAISAREFQAINYPAIGGIRIAACWLPSADEHATEAGLVTPQNWQRFGGAYALPWSTDESPKHSEGWRRIGLASDGETATVLLIDTSIVRVAAWVALLAAAAFARICRARRAPIFAVMVGVVLVALLLPNGWTSFALICSGIWWGLCIGLAMSAFRRPSLATGRAAEAGSAASWRWKRVGATATFLLAALWAVRAWGDDPRTNGKEGRPAAKTAHYQVFCPIDEQQKPVGNKVYVPEPLFTRLERWTLDRQRGPQGSLISVSTARISLDWNSEGTTLEPRSVLAVVDVHTFDDDIQVRLPVVVQRNRDDLDDSEMAMDEAGGAPAIRLDGALVEADSYSTDGESTLIAIAKAGVHRIELPIARQVSEQDGRFSIGFTPFAAGTMRVELTTPENGPDVEVAATGESGILIRARGMLSLPIAIARPLVARWSKSPARAVSERLESSERIRLDVQPGGVSLTAEVLLRGLTGLPEEFRIGVDPRLVPIAAKVDGLSTTWRRANNASDQIAFQLGPRATPAARLEIKFLLSGATGIGNLRLPRWEPQVTVVTRRWLAVNIDPALEREIAAGPEAQPMNVTDFVQDESEDRPPDYAWRLARGTVAWNLTTRQRTHSRRIDQTVSILAEANRARVLVDAGIALRGEIWQHTLKCDPTLRVERILVLEGDRDAVAFWTQTNGLVQVFLSEHAAERQRLRIEGSVEIPEDGKVTIGDIELVESERVNYRTRIYRMPSVGVAIGDLTGFADAATGTTVGASTAPPSAAERFTPPPQARLIRDLVAADGTAPVATLTLSRNVPKIDVTSAVAIEDIDNDAWTMRGEFRGTVRDGMVDELMFDLPGQWSGEPTIEPTMPFTVTETAAGVRRVTVRPVLPLRDRFNIVIEGRVRVPANRAAPRWKCLDCDTAREVLVLPTTWKGRRLGWDFVQLRQTELDKSFSLPKREGARYQSYQAMGGRASATLQADLPSSRSLEAYVDVVATEQSDGTRTLLTTYDLLPTGISSCRIAVPGNSDLVAVILEDRITAPKMLAEGQWQINLDGDSVPQRLQVLTSVDSKSRKVSQTAWEAPVLEDAQIRQTIWRVADSTTAMVKRDGDPVSNQISAANLKALRQLAAAAAGLSVEIKAQVEMRWERRLTSASASPDLAASEAATSTAQAPATRWSYVIASSGAASSPVTQTMIDQFGAKLFGRFGDDEVFQVPVNQSQRFADQFARDVDGTSRVVVVSAPPKITDRTTLMAAVSPEQSLGAVIHDGAAWTLPAVHADKPKLPIGRLAVAFCVIAIGLAFTRSAFRHRATEWMSRQPHLAITAVGILWWLLLWPGWIGLVIAAMGIASAWRLTWPLPAVTTRPRPSNHG